MALTITVKPPPENKDPFWDMKQMVDDRIQPKMSPTISFSGKYQNHLFIVGIGPIINKELEFIYQYDRSDCTYIYT